MAGAPPMNLQIRNPRAYELARRLAQRRGISMTEAVIEALEAELERRHAQVPLADRLGAIADELAAMAKPGGREITQRERDALWGHL